MADDLTTIRGMRDRLGREPTLAEVMDQVKRDHPDERGDALVERLKIAIAIFRQRQQTLGLDDEVPQKIQRAQESQISEGHIIAAAALVGLLVITVVALLSSTNDGIVDSMARSAARGVGYSIGRGIVDHALFGRGRHWR